MNENTELILILILLVVGAGGVFYILNSGIEGIQSFFSGQKRELADYEQTQDDKHRVLGHSEAYVEKQREIRQLREQYKGSEFGMYAALIGGIICLFVFPPLGIVLTGFAVIMSVREGAKLRQAKTAIAQQIAEITKSMPEK